MTAQTKEQILSEDLFKGNTNSILFMNQGKLEITQDPRIQSIERDYPQQALDKLELVRQLILKTASDDENITQLEETLKWGEHSFVVKKGSTIRIDWKEKYPKDIAIYFKCTSLLVPTFQKLYGNLFKYEKTRAILIPFSSHLPEKELGHCIHLALNYHRLKKDPPFVEL